MVPLSPQLFLLVYLHMNVGLPSLPAATSLRVFAPAARLRPSYRSGRMFLLHLLGCWTSTEFNFLTVLFFLFLNLLLSFSWVCEETQCIYLHLHLGWKSIYLLLERGERKKKEGEKYPLPH